MNIVLIGYPGSGKGTQAQALSRQYGFVHISTGDLIRKEIASRTPLGLKVEELTGRGELVCDDLITSLLIESAGGAKDKLLFDGFPRTVAQARELDKYLSGADTRIVAIGLTRQETLKRLTSRRLCAQCGAIYGAFSPDFTGKCVKDGAVLTARPDDTLENATHRLEVFEKETAPLFEYYGASPAFYKVDGARPEREVLASIVALLELKK